MATLAGITFDQRRNVSAITVEFSDSVVEFVNMRVSRLWTNFFLRYCLLLDADSCFFNSMFYMQYREPPSDVGIGLCTHIWVAFGLLLVVTEVLGRVGATIMEGGFFHLRRHGLVG
jgi:hypothetical protein